MPPVILPSAPTTPVPLKRSPSIKSTMTNGERMQDELNMVLSLFREKRKFEVRPTPEVYINQKSNADEVQSWLLAKEFSDNICHKLKNFSGHQLMGLSREQAEAIGGSSEGRRLYSQIKIQRSVCNVSRLLCTVFCF